uniref:Uncharacterized protein n=1 Tax=Arundo donax TaxID=35708 RepID=A0A0A9GW67_ARUDO
MATPRPRLRAVPLRLLLLLLLLLLVPLIYSVSRLHMWAPEKGVCLPPPAAPKRPDRLVLGPAAGQGRPDRLQCRGLKALNKIGVSSHGNHSGEHISFVTVFTTYGSDPAGDGKVPSSYGKIERSMAILNTFISFIQNPAGINAKKQRDHID